MNRRKLYIISSICILVLSVVLYLGFKKPAEKSTLTPAQQKLSTLLEKDSDGDGLKDWEEVLWKTDPQNRDSDGDSTPDGEEVAIGRDPNKPSPNDFQETAPTDQNSTTTTSTTPKNATEAFARDFFGKYISLVKKNGENVTEEDQNKIIEELLTKDYITLKSTAYSATDIITKPDNSEKALRAYGNAIGNIFIRNSPEATENEIAIFESALTIQNNGGDGNSEIQKLDPIIESYRKNVSDIKLLVGPSGSQEYHLLLLNALSGILSSIESLRESFTDPVRGLPTISVYQDYVTLLREAFTQLYAYFTRNNITFTQDEAGYIFSTVI